MDILIKSTGEIKTCSAIDYGIAFIENPFIPNQYLPIAWSGEFTLQFEQWEDETITIPAHDVSTIEAFENVADVGDIMNMLQDSAEYVNKVIREWIVAN